MKQISFLEKKGGFYVSISFCSFFLLVITNYRHCIRDEVLDFVAIKEEISTKELAIFWSKYV